VDLAGLLCQQVPRSFPGGPTFRSAGVSATKEISVLTDHRIERSEVGAPGEFDALSDDDLERALLERISALGLVLEVKSETQG
jgi:hypothetical protein